MIVLYFSYLEVSSSDMVLEDTVRYSIICKYGHVGVVIHNSCIVYVYAATQKAIEITLEVRALSVILLSILSS